MPIPSGYNIPNQIGVFSPTIATEKFAVRGANGERVVTNSAADDANYSLAPSFNFPFYGSNQAIYVSSNSYFTFGTSSTAFNNLSLTSTRGLYIKTRDNSIKYLSEKSFDNKYHVVRYEGQASPSVTSTSVPNIYEVTFFADGVIELNFLVYTATLASFSAITNSSTATGQEIAFSPSTSYVFMPKENPINGYYVDIGSYNKAQTSAPPIPTVLSKSHETLSHYVRESTLRFKFDKKVTQWTVNIGGASPTTGYVADSGGIAAANTEIIAIVDDLELQNEGLNKVNIYGKGEDGIWTAYEA